MAARNVYTFRFDEDTVRMLRELSAAFKLSPAAFLALKIRQEHEALHGNPKMLECLELLDEMAKLAERMGSVASSRDGSDNAIG